MKKKVLAALLLGAALSSALCLGVSASPPDSDAIPDEVLQKAEASLEVVAGAAARKRRPARQREMPQP